MTDTLPPQHVAVLPVAQERRQADRRSSPVATFAGMVGTVDASYLRGMLGGDDPDKVIHQWARLIDTNTDPVGTAGKH